MHASTLQLTEIIFLIAFYCPQCQKSPLVFFPVYFQFLLEILAGFCSKAEDLERSVQNPLGLVSEVGDNHGLSTS